MPQLTWVGKDKVKKHHHDVPFRLLNTKYRYIMVSNDNAPDSTYALSEAVNIISSL